MDRAETHDQTLLLTLQTICITGVVPGQGQATVSGCYGKSRWICQKLLTWQTIGQRRCRIFRVGVASRLCYGSSKRSLAERELPWVTAEIS
jgi:hypothetical protein